MALITLKLRELKDCVAASPEIEAVLEHISEYAANGAHEVKLKIPDEDLISLIKSLGVTSFATPWARRLHEQDLQALGVDLAVKTAA